MEHDRGLEAAVLERPTDSVLDAVIGKCETEKSQARFHGKGANAEDWRFLECRASLVLAYLYPLKAQLERFPTFQEWQAGIRPEGINE